MFFNKSKSKSDPKKSKKDFVAKVLSVLAAIALWFYVVDVQNTVDEITVYDVPIAIENFDNSKGLTIVSGMNNTVDVVVRGAKNDLKDLSNHNIYASVDMSGYNSKGDHLCDVRVKTPDGVSVVSRTVQNVSVSVDILKDSKFEVDVEPLRYVLKDNLEFDSFILSHETVNVSGPTKLIDSIHGAKVRLELGDVSGNIVASEKIVVVNEKGDVINSPYLIISPENVDVSVKVKEKVIEKLIENVAVRIINAPDDFDVKLEDGFEFLSVVVSGAVSKTDIMTSDDIFASVDLSEVSSEGTHQVMVEFSLPDGVVMSKCSSDYVNVICESIVKKHVPVELSVVGITDDTVYSYNLINKKISAIGPRSVIDDVYLALAELNVNDIENKSRVELEFEFVNEAGAVVSDNRLITEYDSVIVEIESLVETGVTDDSAISQIVNYIIKSIEPVHSPNYEYEYLVR